MVLQPDSALVEDGLEQFQQVVAEHISGGNVRLVIDFSEVPFIDSAGLEALLDSMEKAVACGGGLRIAAPSDISKDIFIATRLGSRILIFDDVGEARKSFM